MNNFNNHNKGNNSIQEFTDKFAYYHINTTIQNDIFPIDIGHQIHAKNDAMLENNYPYYLLHFVVTGKGYVTVNGTTTAFTKNSIFILPPDTNVSYIQDKNNPWEYYWINFNGLAASKILKSLNIDNENYYFTKPIPSAKKYFSKALSAKNDIYSLVFTATACLFNIFATIADTLKISTVNNPSKKNLFDQIYDYIKDHLYDPCLSAKNISQIFYINPGYFSSLFKKNLNISFREYINYERIKKATELIETTNLLIKDIAYLVGFSDPLYFGKVFKKYRLIPPEEYKKLQTDHN